MAKILIVDDCEIMRGILRKMLEDGGHKIVGEANNGEAAQDMYSEFKPDLVTMDIQMLGVDGLEALKAIMQSDSAARVLMVTALLNDPKKEQALEFGAAGYVSKPFQTDLLHQQVEMVLRH